MIDDFALDEFAGELEEGWDCTLILKNSIGQQQGNSYPCGVSESQLRPPGEVNRGTQVVSETIWEIATRKSVTARAAWTAFVTFPDSSVVQYHVKAVLGPQSNSSQLTILATKITP